jgi:glycosyltransferase 2 family protein
MAGKPRVRTVVTVVLWMAIGYFLLIVFRQVDWRAVASHRLNLPLAVLVLAMGTGNRFFLPLVWTIALSSLEGRRLRPRQLLWPYAESWMARYLPGKVAFIGTRVLAAERYGYSAVNAVISGGVEVVLQVVLITGLSVILLSLGLGSDLPFNVVPVLVSAAGFAVLISPPVLRRVVDLYLRLQKQTDVSMSYLSWSAVFRAVGVLGAMYVVQSIYSIALGESLGLPVRAHSMLFLGAIFLSSIAGMVAFFSPGGLGVRELVFVQVLQPWFAREELVSFVIFWRLAETVMDLLFVALARLIAAGEP